MMSCNQRCIAHCLSKINSVQEQKSSLHRMEEKNAILSDSPLTTEITQCIIRRGKINDCILSCGLGTGLCRDVLVGV